MTEDADYLEPELLERVNRARALGWEAEGEGIYWCISRISNSRFATWSFGSGKTPAEAWRAAIDKIEDLIRQGQ